jgi:superfamily II DNA or RNA helicase
MAALSDLLEAIREEALSGIWASGVKLARAGAVVLESVAPNEVVLRVKAPGRPVALSAVLHPEDGDWECDCPGRVDPCEHVVAAAITAEQAERAGTAIPAAKERFARVVYRFSRQEGGVGLQRVIGNADGTESPLEKSLAVVMAGAMGARFQVEQYDLIADRLLERAFRGAMRPESLERLLQALDGARDVLLDGVPVAISATPVYPVVTLEDRGPNTQLTFARDHRVTEILSPGVALCGDVIALLGETELSGERLERLPSSRVYSPDQLGDLSAKVLPDLARRLHVDVRTSRVPPVDRGLKPRLVLELKQLDAQLSVLPSLVYGAPAHVRVDGGKMVYLRGAVPLRDEAAETRLVHQLRDELNMIPGHRIFVQGPEMVRLVDKLSRFRGTLAGDAAGVVGAKLKLRPVLTVQTQATGKPAPEASFTLEFRVEGEGGESRSVEAAAVVSAWKEGLGLVPLLGGGWAPLPRAWLDQHGQRVADLLAAREENGKVANHALPQLAELCDALEQPRPPALQKLLPLADDFESLPDPELPTDLRATLRPYQQRGVAWLQFLRRAGVGGVLADDMGLGKTLQTLTVLGKGTLVVCPTSVLPNWRDELQKFRPGLRVCSYHGPARALDPMAEVTLTTYALLRLEQALLTALPWDTVVLDEAQAIKNPDSQVARAAYALKADLRLALSGTPVENRLEELWSVMHFANPGLLGGRKDFDEGWARPIAEGNREATSRLRKRIKPFVLRRLKREVAPDLPPRTESILHVTLDDGERAIYDAIHAATRSEVVALLNQGGSVLKALEALLRLRQAACHPALVPGQRARSSSKVTALLEALQTAAQDGHKALVFSQWTSLLDLIEPELRAADLAFTRLDGSTADRGAVTARFQADDGPPVMLLSLKAGGTGLNLTAADHVFLVDPWWNPAVEAQAADRAHRIGQERPVNVYRLVSQGTVEEKILGLQEKKRALFEAALGEGGAAGALTRDDLLQLFA